LGQVIPNPSREGHEVWSIAAALAKSSGHRRSDPPGQGRAPWAIATLDDERTLYEDPEADVGPGNNVYRSYLRQLAKRSGYPLRITAVKEDCSSQPRSVIVSYRLGDEQKRLVLTNCNDWIDPGVVTGLNDSLPVDGP